MRYLYTRTPDEGCREIEPGVYGRPVHTYEETGLRKKGWSLTINALRGSEDVREEKEGQEETEVTEDLVAAYVERFGKKPHHKMKADTIREKLGQVDD